MQFLVSNAIETAQLRNQQQQIECEQRFRAIFDTTFQFTGLMHPNGTLIEANKTALDFGGLHLSDVVGRPFWEAHWWTISPETQAQLQQAIATAARGEFIRYEVEVLGAGDRIITIDFSIKPIFDDQGQVVLLIPEGRDVSDRIAAERLFRQSESRYATLARFAPVGIFRRDRDGNNIYTNNRYCEITGLSAEETLGLNWATALHPDDRERVLDEWLQASITNGPFQMEYRFVHADGTIRWVIGQMGAEPDDDDQVGYVGTLTDISDRKRAEEALHLSQEQYQMALDLSQIGSWDWDLKTNEVVWNDNHFYLLGLNPDEAEDSYQTWYDRVHPEDIEQIEQLLSQAQATQTNYQSEYRVIYPDGSIRWLMGKGRALYDEAGEPFRMLGVILDISDRKVLEERLQKSEVEFRTVANAAPAVVWACDRDGHNIYMNDRWHEYTGQTRAAAAGYGWAEMVHPEDAERILPYWQRCQQTGEVYEGEVRYRRYDGEYCWHAFRALPRHNADGQIQAWYGLSLDISDRKQIEETLQASEERYRSLVTLTTSIVWRAGSDGGVSWAPEWETFTGQTPEQYLGWGWLDAAHPDDRQHLVEIWTRAMAEKTTGEVEYRLLHRDGQYRYVYAQGVPLLDAQGNVREWIGTVSDITERKQTQLNDQFLNNLDLRLRQLTDVQAMEWEVVSSLGEYLSVDRCLWHEIDWNNGLTTVERTWHCEDVPDVTGIYALQDYFTSQQLNYFAAGETQGYFILDKGRKSF